MNKIDRSKLMAILFDNTRCIGCRSCEDACEQENASRKRKWSEKSNKGFRQPPTGLSCDHWLYMSFHQFPEKKGQHLKPFNWDDALEFMEKNQYSYIRHACMHCVEPACETACTVGALEKFENGAVIVNPHKCIGCRYCMMACQFSVPKWEWHETLPYIRKCTMCNDLQKRGKIPACVDNCPGNDSGPALVFGNRDELLYEAEKRVHENKELYLAKVFGRDEVGGTGVLYIMNKSLNPSEVGFPENLGKRSLPNYAKSPQSTVPYWVGGLGIMLCALNWLIKRRDQVMTDEVTPPDIEEYKE